LVVYGVFALGNDLYCDGWGVKLYSLTYSVTHSLTHSLTLLIVASFCFVTDSHGSASVLKAMKQVNGKGQKSTPCHAKTLNRSSPKMSMCDYVVSRHPACKIL